MGSVNERDLNFVKNAISRRMLLRGAGAATGLALVSGQRRFGLAQSTPTASFEGRQMTFASWGGAYQDAQKKAYCDPFAAASRVTILQDGPVDDAKTRAMGESGA